MSANLNDFFPYKVCINLDRRADRWERVQARFARHRINEVFRFPALDGEKLDSPQGWTDGPGAYGCLRSHLEVVRQAREKELPSLLIFEDDVDFDEEFESMFARYIEQLPDDWEMLMLGGIHLQKPVEVSKNISRIKRSFSTFAYALKQSVYDSFIELNNLARTTVDDNNTNLQERFNCYCFMPHLAWVEDDYSDVRYDKQSHWYVKESLVLWGSEMDQVLKSAVAVILHHNHHHNTLGLNFILNHYQKYLPGLTILIIEQGERPSLKIEDLPSGCQYHYMKTNGHPNRIEAFNAGFRLSESDKDYFMFTDSNIFLEAIDVKPNLLKCRQYDFVSSFKFLYELTEEDTLKFFENKMLWHDKAKYHPQEKSGLCSSCCIITKDGLRMVGGWTETTSQAVERLLRVYNSPNRAWRLFGAREAL